AVFERTILLVLHELDGVLSDVGSQLGRELTSDHCPAFVEHGFGADRGSRDHRRHRPELFGFEGGGYRLVDPSHQGSMKTSMVPPHDIPTSKASSSAMP